MDSLRPKLARLAGRIPPLRPGRFGWGAAQLTGATLVSRAIGFVYSAAVMRLAGPEAVGLFRVAWPLYATAFTLATSGVPYAMAKLLAEQADPQAIGAERARAVARVGLGILLATSSLAALLLWGVSPWLMGRVASEPRATVLVQLLAPSLVLATLASGCRALFEGVRRMAVPAASLLVEQAVLAGLAILLVALLAGPKAGPEPAAVALAMASVAGEAAGLVVLALFVNRLWSSWPNPPAAASRPAAPAPAPAPALPSSRPGPAGPPAAPSPGRWALRGILALALPVAGGRLLASAGAGFNSLVLPNRLQAAGLSASEAAAQIGLLRGVALPIVLMPNMLSVALMTTLVPSISGAMARQRPDLARVYSDKAIAATLLFALPVTATLAAFPESITRLLYGEAQAAPLLLISAAAAPFVYLGQTLVGVLRGLGRPHVPVQAHLAGLAVDTLVVGLLAGQPSVGVRGGAWASVAGYATACAVNQLDTLRRLGTALRADHFALPVLGALTGALVGRAAGAAAFSAAAAAGASTLLADLAGLLAGGTTLALIYGVCLLRCRLWRWLVER